MLHNLYILEQFLYNVDRLRDLNARKQWNRVHIYRQFLPAMSILFTLVSPICWLVLSTAIYITPINFSLQQNTSHFPNWICVVLSLLENWLRWFRVQCMQTWEISKLHQPEYLFMFIFVLIGLFLNRYSCLAKNYGCMFGSGCVTCNLRLPLFYIFTLFIGSTPRELRAK